MRKILILFCCLLIINFSFGQANNTPSKVKIMPLGVYHFAYHNLDVEKTKDEDKISVLEEPYHSEILSICRAIEEFKPTIIAIERTPSSQKSIDSLFSLYKSGKLVLKKDEIYQLAFRIGEKMNLNTINCVNDWGRHYPNLESIFKDSIRLDRFEKEFHNSPDSVYVQREKSKKVTSIADELIRLNNPERIKERLSVYLLNSFKYEEEEGDFTGVDFETGRWFNRNLRIFRNIQRIKYDSSDRILLIIGSDHLNLLNMFFETSKEFDFVSPLPYLEK